MCSMKVMRKKTLRLSRPRRYRTDAGDMTYADCTPNTWRINWWSLCCLRLRKKESMFRCWFHLISSFPDDRDRLSRLFLLLFGLKTCFWGHMGPISKSYGATLSVFSIFGRQVKLWSCQTVNWCKLQFSWCSRTFAECPFCEFLRRETNRSLLLHSGSAKTLGSTS